MPVLAPWRWLLRLGLVGVAMATLWQALVLAVDGCVSAGVVLCAARALTATSASSFGVPTRRPGSYRNRIDPPYPQRDRWNSPVIDMHAWILHSISTTLASDFRIRAKPVPSVEFANALMCMRVKREVEMPPGKLAQLLSVERGRRRRR